MTASASVSGSEHGALAHEQLGVGRANAAALRSGNRVARHDTPGGSTEYLPYHINKITLGAASVSHNDTAVGKWAQLLQHSCGLPHRHRNQHHLGAT